MAGFFAHEHVEVEVQVEADPLKEHKGTSGDEPPAAADDKGGDDPGRGPGEGRRWGRPSFRRPPTAPNEGDELGYGAGGSDPMTELIEEMAQNGPSSVLDLAEKVNSEQSRFVVAEGRAGRVRPVTPQGRARPAPSKGNDRNEAPVGFAAVLERIARQENLVSPDHEDEILPDSCEPLAAPSPAPARHAGAILTDLAAPRRPVPDLVLALHGLGLPPTACAALSPGTSREALEAELRRALEAALPVLAPMPRSAASVVAVVGPRGQVMETARALAVDLGTPKDEVALATQRNVWRQQDRVIASPEDAVEERRSWRWRGHPSVVAIEVAVRPDGAGAAWAGAMLRAFEPTMCWGVAEASRKPEDVAAWSAALGGLDALALVDLDGTTTPAAALTTSLPVGRLDGHPATPEVWARVLCSRLTAG
jgi:hypothetical protein